METTTVNISFKKDLEIRGLCKIPGDELELQTMNSSIINISQLINC